MSCPPPRNGQLFGTVMIRKGSVVTVKKSFRSLSGLLMQRGMVGKVQMIAGGNAFLRFGDRDTWIYSIEFGKLRAKADASESEPVLQPSPQPVPEPASDSEDFKELGDEVLGDIVSRAIDYACLEMSSHDRDEDVVSVISAGCRSPIESPPQNAPQSLAHLHEGPVLHTQGLSPCARSKFSQRLRLQDLPPRPEPFPMDCLLESTSVAASSVVVSEFSRPPSSSPSRWAHQSSRAVAAWLSSPGSAESDVILRPAASPPHFSFRLSGRPADTATHNADFAAKIEMCAQGRWPTQAGEAETESEKSWCSFRKPASEASGMKRSAEASTLHRAVQQVASPSRRRHIDAAI